MMPRAESHPPNAAANRARLVELGGSGDKSLLNQALQLYEYLFPDRDEREDPELIRERLSHMGKIATDEVLRSRYRESRFHVLAALDSASRVIGFAQFSVLPLAGNIGTIAFMQYAGTADADFMRRAYGTDTDWRRRGVSSALLTKTEEIAAKSGDFLGTLLESEMIGQASTEADIAFTKLRLRIHDRQGSKVIMLRMPGGALVSPHVQPRLSEQSLPIRLHLLFRPSRGAGPVETALIRKIVLAFIDNFRREGFAENDVREAEAKILKRFAAAEAAVLVEPDRLSDITELAQNDTLLKRQIEAAYGDVSAHARRIRSALSGFTGKS